MKTMKFFGLVLAVGVLCFASAKQVAAGQSEYSGSGCLRMKHSPVLGINIPITVWIDGKLEGPFTKGHIFERCLTPGQHHLYVMRPRNAFDSYSGMLDVRAGEIYSFVVKVTPNRVVLQPTGPLK